MATPLETNTTELEGLLQDVYNLPDRSSSGSSEPDLVIQYEAPSGSYISDENIVDRFSFENINFENLVEKLKNLENVVCHIKVIAYYGESKFSGVSKVESIFHAVYNGNDQIHVIFIIPSTGAWDYPKYRVSLILANDGTIERAKAERIPYV